jgi:hypothetical protein
LRDFLSRAAANRANKSTPIAGRTSADHRRDSDAVRQALSSPYKVLEEKDPNSPSPTKPKSQREIPASPLGPTNPAESEHTETLEAIADLSASGSPAKRTRRSTRRRTKIPQAPGSAQESSNSGVNSAPAVPNKIPVRRADGSEPIVLKKTEAQELAWLTRTNTRRNKIGALLPHLRLARLSSEVSKDTKGKPPSPPVDEVMVPDRRGKGVQWDEQLVYFEQGSSATTIPDDLANGLESVTVSSKSNHASIARRLRSFQGTPMKPSSNGLLSLSASMENDNEPAKVDKADRAPSPKKTRVPRKIPSTPAKATSTPVGAGGDAMESSKAGFDWPPAAGTRRRKKI